MSRSTTFAFIGQDKFSKTADQVSRKAGGMSGKLAGAGKKLAVGAAAAGAAVAGLAVAGMSAIKAAEGQATADARLAQVFKSMGYEENAAAAKEYADALESTIAVDSEVIEGAQAKLATFKDLAKSQDLMARTTKVAADLSAAGFGDMGTQAVGLGKALQDPIKGMTLLTKQGALTKDEQSKIAAEFERTGDKAAAQESILKALEKQVGGVAEATANGSDKMGIAFDNVKESIGMALMPAFDKLVPVVQNAAVWFSEKLMPALTDLGRKIMPTLTQWWGKVTAAIEENRPGLEKLWNVFKMVGQVIVTKVLPAYFKFQAFLTGTLLKALGKIGDFAPTLATFFLRGLAQIVRGFGSFYKVVTGVLEGILTVAEKTLGWIPGIGDKVKDAKAAFSDFRDHSVAKIDGVAHSLENAADKVEEWDRAADQAKEAKLKAEIGDLTSKIATAKRELASEDLTKERKAKLKADIADLRAKVKEANDKLASVKSKTVTVTAKVVIRGDGTFRIPGVPGRIPAMAAGGIVTQPTLALVGEAGPEAVIPLKDKDRRLGGGGVTVNIYGGFASAEEIARTTYKALADYQRSTGRQILATA